MGDREPATEDYHPLLEGNGRFRNSNKDFKAMAGSQKPNYVVVTCSDSRVPPSIIFDAPLGSIFEIRMAGGVMNNSALGSVEFAVNYLGNREIIVMGHTKCGAVTAAYEIINGNAPEPEDISPLSFLVKDIQNTLSSSNHGGRSIDACVKENTRRQAERLLNSNLIRALHEAGELDIKSAIYDLSTGLVSFFQWWGQENDHPTEKNEGFRGDLPYRA